MRYPWFFPLMQTQDAGGSGGGQQQQQQQSGGQQGGQGGGFGSGGGSQGGFGSGSAPIKLSDDALVDPGDGKPIKYGDYKKQFIPRSEHESTIQNNQKALLTRLQALAKQAQAQKNSAGQQQQPRDPLGNLRGKQIIGGEDLGGLYETLNTERLTPLEQHVLKLEQEIQQLRGGVGSVHERNATHDHQQRMNGAIQALGLGEEYDANDPVLKDLAEDVYLSYDPHDPKLNTEYPGILKARIEGMIKLIRKADARKLELAKTKKRTFVRPGGNGVPGAQGRGQVETARTLASRLFAREGADT